MSPIKLLSRLIPATSAVAAVLALALWLRPLEAQVPIQRDSDGVTVDPGGRLLHRSPIRLGAPYAAGGLLVVDATLSPKGQVTDARVVSGPEALRSEALQSILQWHYDTPGGAPSAVRISIQYAPRPDAPPAPNTLSGTIIRANSPLINRTGEAISSNARKVSGLEFVGVEPALRERMEARLKDYVGKDITLATIPEISQAVNEVDDHARMTYRDSPDHTAVAIEISAMVSVPRQASELRLGRDLERTIMPAATPPPGAIRVGGNVQSAKLLQKVDPVYPPLALDAKIQGTVRFNAIISREGRIANLQLISGHPLLVQPATDAVRQWLYATTLLNGQPTDVMTEVEVVFKLP